MHKIISRTGGFLICRNFRFAINSACGDHQKLLSKNSSENFSIIHSFYFGNINKTTRNMSSSTETPSSSEAAAAAATTSESAESSSSLSEAATSTASSSEENVPSKYTNRLIHEKSPYLLQHAHNPVDWYPWCDEAIQKAKNENKVIFLSVGYSTCHWCHVMEYESFENEEIAKIMNENFINIKVDREERPDIDKIYMHFLSLFRVKGGWPMSVWLAPDLIPIFAGTYFPPTNQWGVSSFKTILLSVANSWKNDQQNLNSPHNRLSQGIQKLVLSGGDDYNGFSNMTRVPESQLIRSLKEYKKDYDAVNGGFKGIQKFPEVPKLIFLLHSYTIKKDKSILDMVLKTLHKMGNGGIHDHIFGGFSRYTVDPQWHVPHFEKMLYDQGQLLSVYANAYKITNSEYYLNIADSIYEYIMKDLRHPLGGFYSGEDADSLPSFNSDKKVEGAFYSWTYIQMRSIFETLTKRIHENYNSGKLFDIYCYHYGIKEKGNVAPIYDLHGHFIGKNILHINKSLKKTSEKFQIEKSELEIILKRANKVLREVRSHRPRPDLDTKIIAAWNGLVLSGLSKISMSCTEKRNDYLKAAKDLITFLKTYLYDKEKKILLRACYGKGTNDNSVEIPSEPIPGFLVDYAFLIKGLLDYYKATLDLSALEWAKELQDIQDKLFWDNAHGGYFYSQENLTVIARLKEDHDGVEPSGNSVAARNLILLSAYFEEPQYKEKARKLFHFFFKSMNESDRLLGIIFPEMLTALLLLDRGLEMTAVVGTDCDKTKEFLDICRRYYIPGMIAVHFNVNNPSLVKRKTAEKFKMINNQTTVYICHNKVCQLPITDPNKLEEEFKSRYSVTEKNYYSDDSDD